MIDSLLQVPGLADRAARDARVQELRSALKRPFDPPRHDAVQDDLSTTVAAAVAVSGGLRTLARIVHQHHPGEASSRFMELANDVVGPFLLAQPDRDRLRDSLTQISIVDIADAVTVIGDVPELRTLQIWRDIPAAIRVMERLPLSESGVPPLLAFVDRLADIETGPVEADLREWLAIVASGITAESTRPSQRPGPVLSGDTRTRGRRADEPGLIWSGVPIRNRNFTGRVALLDRLAEALRTSSTTSVLPQTLQGLGGVGKTQLVIEFVYRHLDQYDLVWWIPAEQTATVLNSLAQLADRLGLPSAEDRQETARAVLDALAGSDLAWLLVYDNADDPSSLQQLVPSTGGHVIVTTRIQEWSKVGVAIEVDVFKREESIELLANRSRDVHGNPRISALEADELAERLGDLPLALEQAVAWYLATAMPVREYIDLLDSHTKELLDEGKPANYPLTVAAFVGLAVEKLRDAAEATAQLFALFAYLGGEPIPLSLLRHGSKAAVTEPLRTILGASIPMNRTVRDLSRYGLAKVDPLQRIQVHRLVQRVLRDTLSPEQREETLRNVQNLLAAANPGDPDEHGEWERQRDMGPHIEPADMIHSQTYASRQAVLDHSRYLYLSGDYENSRYLADQAAKAWADVPGDPQLGPDGEQTLMAKAQLANATRTLGDSQTAAAVMADTYRRFPANPLLGPRHEFTLITGNQVGLDLRIAGRYQEAFEFDRENVELHREVFGPGETYTLRAEANLAVDYRMLGRFLEAQALDRQIAAHWADVDASDPRALYAYMNLARSEYGLGAYGAGLERLEAWRGVLQDRSGPGHSQVLLAGRTYAIILRKVGRLAEAAEVMREIRDRTEKRFTPDHEFAVAATMSYANVLREVGEVEEALRHIADALRRYRANFGPTHPLSLVAQVNEAIARRSVGDVEVAQTLDADCFDQLGRVLAPDHPYTICAGVSLATDHARAGRHQEALQLSQAMLDLSREADRGAADARDGAEHPYVVMRAINLSHDLRATGSAEAAEALFQESLASLRRALGSGHPEVVLAEQGYRLEGDIEPPPT
ncbi:FxSxx-COOH system tetratricopeptide repeat protein [Actinoplanes subtropicus]|uniref:FxSxx-COOH system tetratricopeptide repeat protein n=1 Tax=Actinoplanes subtropicus TaxID=543632 RepID=UPI0012F7BDA8|nr:FxSxx-COOH system tetratricopeptide repeat protein [Actinoplanes subtropicus]